MSSGGVFKLIANDGKSDRLLVATALLNQRIRDVICARRNMGKDPTPTLLDLEKTHVLHINAHFKPFAALGYEYNKVRTQSGGMTLGSTVQFSIPQFGDFFHDMVCRVVLSSTYEEGRTSDVARGDLLNQQYGLRSSFPVDGNDWDGEDIEEGAALYTLVDAFGFPVLEAAGQNQPLSRRRNMVRYCEYPAERLFSEVRFEINNNPLDAYDWRASNMLRKFTIFDEKLEGYKRLAGQEVAVAGVGGPRLARIEDTHYNMQPGAPLVRANHGVQNAPYFGSAQNVGLTPAEYTAGPRHVGGDLNPTQWSFSSSQEYSTQAAQTGALPFPDPQNVSLGTGSFVGSQNMHVQRQQVSVFDGPQTPKYWQPELEIWNRLWFWFCLDARLSIPSVSIPFGQRYVSVAFSDASAIVQDFPGVFVKRVSHTLDGAAAVANAANSTQFGSVEATYRPYWEQSSISYPTIQTVELYINNIFVNPEVHDLFIRRLGFALIRVFRQQVNSHNSSDGQQLLSQLKWPIEVIFCGFQPQINAMTSNVNYSRDWHRYGKTYDSKAVKTQQAFTGLRRLEEAGEIGYFSSSIGEIVDDTFVIERPIVKDVSLTAHGVKIHDQFPQAFFSTYEPFHYGGIGIRPPQDPGVMMINFALFTGCYQPSGYINVSRARELYVMWNTGYIGANTPITFSALAVAINFLLVTDGSAVLRYST